MSRCTNEQNEAASGVVVANLCLSVNNCRLGSAGTRLTRLASCVHSEHQRMSLHPLMNLADHMCRPKIQDQRGQLRQGAEEIHKVMMSYAVGMV
jgi:hypothetical protein